MLKKTLTAAVAAAVLSACPAQAAETIDYRIGLNMAGTWSETVRADLDDERRRPRRHRGGRRARHDARASR